MILFPFNASSCNFAVNSIDITAQGIRDTLPNVFIAEFKDISEDLSWYRGPLTLAVDPEKKTFDIHRGRLAVGGELYLNSDLGTLAYICKYRSYRSGLGVCYLATEYGLVYRQTASGWLCDIIEEKAVETDPEGLRFLLNG